MTGRCAVVLSASVPEPSRAGFGNFDHPCMVWATRAFAQMVLGRRLLVRGVQPALKPIIPEAARRLEVPYHRCFLLYQDAFLNHRYPQTNLWFDKWREVPAVEGDAQASLGRLRERKLDIDPSEPHVVRFGPIALKTR